MVGSPYCRSCGLIIDRDLNASRNILQEALRIKKKKHRKLAMLNKRGVNVRLLRTQPAKAVRVEAFINFYMFL